MCAKTYKEKVILKRVSVFGESEAEYLPADLPQSPIIAAWLDDNDIQQLEITSANIGFTYTLTKQYRK